MAFRILVADDQSETLAALAALLQRPGCTVELVTSGSDALRRLLQEGPFDLSLLDLHMPGLSGLEVLAQIRSMGLMVPSILMTSNPTRAVELAALELGVITMLRKPIPAEVLQIVVEQVLRPHIDRP
ncbi:MAG: response regulator [Planctomycetota bacterium]|nr:response regulator [Planctomycetota bacterium]